MPAELFSTARRPPRRFATTPRSRHSVGGAREDEGRRTGVELGGGGMGDTAAARHAELSQEIDEANYRYYVLDAPTFSDIEYYTRMRELLTLEEAHPELR